MDKFSFKKKKFQVSIPDWDDDRFYSREAYDAESAAEEAVEDNDDDHFDGEIDVIVRDEDGNVFEYIVETEYTKNYNAHLKELLK